MTISIRNALDVGKSVFEAHKKDDLQMTFSEVNSQALNDCFGKDKAILSGGDRIKSWITLKDTGNARMAGTGWEEDSHNTVNTDSEVVSDWCQFTTNMDYSRIELGYTQDDALRTYRYLQEKKLNMFREAGELLSKKIWKTPVNEEDPLNPVGIAGWLSMGTDTEGGFTGYTSQYSGAGDAFNIGGVSCSATDKPRWASYYGNHDGKLGDHLIDLIDFAMMKTKFTTPNIIQKLDKDTNMHNFRFFTNAKIRRNINGLLRKSDDRIGSDLAKYSGVPFYQGIPVIYVEALDTDQANLWDADPFYGVNMDYFKTYVSKANNFATLGPNVRDPNHNILSIYLDLSFCFHCKNRQRLGFLLSNRD